MRYLITGGAGFIGSHLVQRLLQRGEEVIAMDNLSTGAAENMTSFQSHPQFTFVHGSVLDQLLVEETVAEADVVVHLAAAVGVRLIVEQPLKSLITNIRGSENVLEAAWKRGVKTLVTSTSEIYGKNSAVPLSETHDRILGPPSIARWAYSTSKAVDEILALAYHREKGLPTVIVRLFNTVGPRQTGRYGMVIPTLIAQALQGEELTVFGDGAQTRCFCYVDDTIEALVTLLDNPSAEGEIFNVGNPEEISITDLAKKIIERTGSNSELRFVPYEEAYEE
ncbi:MAG: UDP-glucose 4-epimerase, partial [Actinomycetota bacterium]|nr:UDP-glucose 4-epimerase [Actinomycetota bacterium]